MQSPFLSSLRAGLWLLCAWPLLAQAGPADEFAAATRAQQAKLLQAWAAEPDAARLPLLQGLQQETVAIDGAKRAFIRQGDRYLPLEGEAAPVGEPKKVWLNNRLRILIANALSAQRLVSADAAVRLQAATALQREAQGEQLPLLTRRLAQEKDPQVRDALSIALANLQLADASPQVRFNAVRLLGESGEPETRARLQALTDAANEPDAAVRAEAQRSLQRVQHRLMIGDLLGQAFSGLSLGSILLLAALGLAITYGLIGVINMAHGEFLMIGAYSAYLVQGLFQQFAPQWLALYPLAGAVGAWGISLVLIQLVRVLFGAQNVQVVNPAWLSGGVQLLPNLVLPWNRIAVIAFVLLVLALTWLLLNKTRLGMNVRAVTQNRAMAALAGWRCRSWATSGRSWGKVTLSTRSWWWCSAASASWRGRWRRPSASASSTRSSSRRSAPCWARS